MEKLTKNRDLTIKTSHLWRKHTSMVPIVIGALGTISRNFTQYYKQLQILEITPSELQKTAILGNSIHTVSIFNRYLGFFFVKTCICYIIPFNVFILLTVLGILE